MKKCKDKLQGEDEPRENNPNPWGQTGISFNIDYAKKKKIHSELSLDTH